MTPERPTHAGDGANRRREMSERADAGQDDWDDDYDGESDECEHEARFQAEQMEAYFAECNRDG